MKRIPSWRAPLLVLVPALAVAACAAGDARFTADTPAGFWAGLWHGMISLITLILGLFYDTVEVYERHNSGGWYDLGFICGIGMMAGGGARRGPARPRHNRKDQKEWDEVAAKVEAKLRRRIRAWAEAEPDEDWQLVEQKAEEKLKRKLRAWAEAPEKLDEPPSAGH